uniref:CSON012602 protein n=1 Tax=Culicoides sonorensis TaxID=179676 RepID=A0A336M5S3_CULSO
MTETSINICYAFVVINVLILMSILIFTTIMNVSIETSYILIVFNLFVTVIHVFIYLLPSLTILISALYASYLIQKLTSDLRTCLYEENWEKFQIVTKLYMEVLNFMKLVFEILKHCLAMLCLNIFMGIIVQVGSCYERITAREEFIRKNSIKAVLTSVGFLCLSITQLFFIVYGPQTLLNECLKLRNLIHSMTKQNCSVKLTKIES